MTKVIPIHALDDFKARSKAVLDDPAQRKNFRGAMDFLQAKRRGQFPDQEELQGLRELGAHIRRYSLANLPRLLEQLEHKLTARGIQVLNLKKNWISSSTAFWQAINQFNYWNW